MPIDQSNPREVVVYEFTSLRVLSVVELLIEHLPTPYIPSGGEINFLTVNDPTDVFRGFPTLRA